MSITVGVDIIEIDRIRKAIDRWGRRFLQRVYTSKEIAYCRGRTNSLAARFAAKEAVMKALGANGKRISWQDIEVIRKPGGPPSIALHGHAAEQAKAMGIDELAISLSHSTDYAIASAIGNSE